MTSKRFHHCAIFVSDFDGNSHNMPTWSKMFERVSVECPFNLGQLVHNCSKRLGCTVMFVSLDSIPCVTALETLSDNRAFKEMAVGADSWWQLPWKPLPTCHEALCDWPIIIWLPEQNAAYFCSYGRIEFSKVHSCGCEESTFFFLSFKECEEYRWWCFAGTIRNNVY